MKLINRTGKRLELEVGSSAQVEPDYVYSLGDDGSVCIEDFFDTVVITGSPQSSLFFAHMYIMYTMYTFPSLFLFFPLMISVRISLDLLGVNYPNTNVNWGISV